MKKGITVIFFLIFSVKLFAYKESVDIGGKFIQTKMSSVNLLYYDVVKGDFTYISTSSVSVEGNFLFAFKLTKPVYCKFYEDFFFITPGDSINIEINDDSLSAKGYKLKISGKNACHYEFSEFLKNKSEINIDKEIKNYKGNWKEFQKTCYKKYQQDTLLLGIYTLKNKASVEFKNYLKEYLFSEYLQYPLIPLYRTVNYDVPLIEKQYQLINIDSVFNVETLFQHQPFRQFCGDYLKFIKSKEVINKSTSGENLALYYYFNSKYTGHIRELFLAFIFNAALKKTAQEEKEVIKKISSNSEFFKDEAIREYIQAKYVLFANISNKLPDSITNIQLISIDGSKTSLKKIIESFKGKYILIDNWATWCGPCLQEIEKASEVQNTGVVEKDGIIILYLSEDKNSASWESYMKKNGKELKYSFLYSNVPNSFMQYFNITTIPRYVLLGKEGQLLDADAPRISEYGNLLKVINQRSNITN